MTQDLKHDALGTTRLVTAGDDSFVERDTRTAHAALRWLARLLAAREAAVLAVVALAIAIPVAMAASRLIESFLFGTTPNDPRTLAAAAGVLLLAALAAGYGPARRASRVDPMAALRHE